MRISDWSSDVCSSDLDLRIKNPEAYLFQTAANLLRDRARRDISRREAKEQIKLQEQDRFEEISPERVLLGKQRISAWPAAEMVHSVLDSIVSCSSIRNMVRALPFNRGVGLERDGAVQHEQIGGSDRCMRGSRLRSCVSTGRTGI